jgi:hypothetical protein
MTGCPIVVARLLRDRVGLLTLSKQKYPVLFRKNPRDKDGAPSGLINVELFLMQRRVALYNHRPLA